MHQAALSPGFEKLVTDFFGGKEVKLDYDCAFAGAKNHVITYNTNPMPEKVWSECRENPVFSRLLLDLVMCDDMEEHRIKRVRWHHGARVHYLKIDNHSGDAEIVALLKVLAAGKGKQSQAGEISGILSVAALHINTEDNSAAQSNDTSDANSREASNLTHSSLASTSQENSKEQNDDKEDDAWMNTSIDHQIEKAPKKSSKKGSKNHNNVNQKPSQVSTALYGESEEKPPISEEPEAPVSNPMSEPSDSFEDSSLDEKSGDWSIVQTEVPPGQVRSLNDSSTGTDHSAIRGSSGGQLRQPNPLFHQVSNYGVSPNSVLSSLLLEESSLFTITKCLRTNSETRGPKPCDNEEYYTPKAARRF